MTEGEQAPKSSRPPKASGAPGTSKPPRASQPHHAQDAQALKELRAFSPSTRPILIAALANVVLAGLCLGVPYYRGKLQAQDALAGFPAFAGCMLGGKPNAGMSLGLPAGERDHFAAEVMHGPDDWPARCNDALEAMAPEEAIFLWPSVKQAGADLRAVVGLLRSELAALSRQRTGGERSRIPERPLLALERLRAGLTLMAEATSTDASLDENAVTFDAAPSIAQPARLPIYAAATAALEVWTGADGLEATAMDRRGISWLRVESGKFDRQRVRRTGLMRGLVRADGAPVIVWATPPGKCDQADGYCVRRATGLALFDKGAHVLPTPTWFGGHPAGRHDRSLRMAASGRVDMLAVANADGALEVRRYHFEPSTNPKARPRAPLERWRLPAGPRPNDALMLRGASPAVVYADADDGRSSFYRFAYSAGTPGELLGQLDGGRPWTAACDSGGDRWLLLASSRELSMLGLHSDGTRTVAAPIALTLDAPLHGEDPAGDRFRLLCRGDTVTLIGVATGRALAHVRCGRGGCRQLEPLAKNVARFDAVAHGEGTVVAYTTGTAPQIAVLRLDAQGKRLGDRIAPAACWDPQRGMCGQPTLVSHASRLLLGARDGSDLLAIESDDGGEHWHAMSGLKVSTAVSTDASAPMDQHRIRKGRDPLKDEHRR